MQNTEKRCVSFYRRQLAHSKGLGEVGGTAPSKAKLIYGKARVQNPYYVLFKW